MSSKLAPSILIVVWLSAPGARAANPKPTAESIAHQVMCLCGCVATLDHCPHMDCATREEMRAMIQKEIAAGKDETTILQDLAIRYGVQVRAAPPPRGFNLTVWVLPAIGLLGGLGLVLVMVRRWLHPASRDPAAAASPATVDPQLLAAMEEEMKSSGVGKSS